MAVQRAAKGIKDKLTNRRTQLLLVCVCCCKAAHASGLVSELIIAHLGINVRAGGSNGLFILSE